MTAATAIKITDERLDNVSYSNEEFESSSFTSGYSKELRSPYFTVSDDPTMYIPKYNVPGLVSIVAKGNMVEEGNGYSVNAELHVKASGGERTIIFDCFPVVAC